MNRRNFLSSWIFGAALSILPEGKKAEAITAELITPAPIEPTIQRLRLNEGETLVVSCPEYLDHVKGQRMRAMFKQGFPNNKILILDDGAKVQAIVTDSSQEQCSHCGGNHWRPDCPEIAKMQKANRIGDGVA